MGLLAAYDARNGALLWKRKSPPCGYGALPFANEFWMLEYVRTGGKGDSVQARVLDPRTGNTKREFRAKGTVNSKCYPAKGSADYLLYSNSWTLDRKTGSALGQNTVRSPCNLGQIPANGMTYYLPHHCDCAVFFRGMLAMARADKRKWLPDAARESDHRAARHRPSASAESANDAPAVKVLRPAIREILGEAWRRIGWAYRAETA